MVYVISSKDFEIRFYINMITQIINWKTLFVLVEHRFQQLFSHITTVSGCDEAKLTFLVLLRWSIMAQTLILILGRPVLALPRKSECQASTILTTLVYRGPGSNPWPPIPRSRHSTDWPTEADKTGRRLYTPAGNVFIVQYINRDEEVTLVDHSIPTTSRDRTKKEQNNGEKKKNNDTSTYIMVYTILQAALLNSVQWPLQLGFCIIFLPLRDKVCVLTESFSYYFWYRENTRPYCCNIHNGLVYCFIKHT